MQILVFTKGDRRVPSSNFRAWILTDYLNKKYGWGFDILHSISYSFWFSFWKRFSFWKDIFHRLRDGKPNLIFVHKVHFPFDVALIILFLKKLRRLPVIYDIDDPQWRNSRAQDFILSRIADRIFCSSKAFMDHYRMVNPNVVYVPTVLDHEYYAKFKTSYTQKVEFIIGWVGDAVGHHKFGNFHIIKPVLEELGKIGYRIRFLVVGTRGSREVENFLASGVYNFEAVSFVPFGDVPSYIQKFDVGVAPVNDIEWFQINATAKGIEYMACGVPTVASPVGAYRELVRDGQNGFTASSSSRDEWIAKIKRLLDDAKLRKRLGESGMETVKSSYSYEAILPRVRKEFEAIAKK